MGGKDLGGTERSVTFGRKRTCLSGKISARVLGESRTIFGSHRSLEKVYPGSQLREEVQRNSVPGGPWDGSGG